jgi:hypothetical protein
MAAMWRTEIYDTETKETKEYPFYLDTFRNGDSTVELDRKSIRSSPFTCGRCNTVGRCLNFSGRARLDTEDWVPVWGNMNPTSWCKCEECKDSTPELIIQVNRENWENSGWQFLHFFPKLRLCKQVVPFLQNGTVP